ncbi:MAG: cupin domain-containing protein [Actinomycetota bacterium]
MMRGAMRAMWAVALSLVAGVVAVPVGAGANTTGTTATVGVTPPTLPVAGSVVRANGITRTILSVSAPANAPGQVLYLTRVRIAPKATLTEHFHDGTQIASVQSGVLTYRITGGSTVITDRDGTARTVTGPTTVRIPAGASLTEGAGLTHYGGNDTAKPVVILTAALIAEGAGLATPVGSTTPGTPLTISTTTGVTENRLVTLATPAGSRLVGTAVETADATVGNGPLAGRAVSVTLDKQITYLDGSGPWSAVLTLRFADGSTIVGAVQGATVATNGGGAAFAATIAVLGGSGAFAGITGGTGTSTGGRSGALGATPLPTEIALQVTGL